MSTTYTWSQYAQGSTWVIVSGSYTTETTLYEVLASDSTFYVTLPNRSISITSNVDGQAYYYVPPHRITLTYPSGSTYSKNIGEAFHSNPLTKGTTVTMPAITSNNSFSTSTYFKSTNSTTAYIDCPVVLQSAQITYTNSGMGYMSLPEITVVTVRVRLNVPPTFTSTQVSFDTAYVYTGLTTASVTVSDLTAYYGGSISDVTLQIGTATDSRSDNGVLSILLDTVGTFTPTVTATDSRGQTKTITLDPITVNGYNAPTVNFTAERTTSTGTPDDEGTYATLDATFVFTDVVAEAYAPSVVMTDEQGTQTTPTVTWYSSRASDGTLSGSVTWSSLSSGDTVYGLVPNLNTQYSYQISVRPRDKIGSTVNTGTAITQTIAPAFYTVDFLAGGHGISFGKPASNVGFECAMDATFEETLTAQDMTAQEIDDFVDSIGGGGDPIADVVVEADVVSGTNGKIRWHKWSSGRLEIDIYFRDFTLASYGTSAVIGGYGFNYPLNWVNSSGGKCPACIDTDYTVTTSWVIAGGHAVPSTIFGRTTSGCTLYALGELGSTQPIQLNIHIVGEWK